MAKTKNNFLSGAIVLTLCSLLTKVIGAIYKIPLLKTLGSDGLGAYQMILSIFALFLVICSGGIVVALSKLVSVQVAYHNKSNQKKYLLSALLITALFSVFLAVVLASLSGVLSTYQGLNFGKACYFALIPTLIASAVTSVFRGYFLGKKQMLTSGVVNVFEAVCKLVFSLGLSVFFARKNSFLAVFGAILGLAISEVFTFLFCIAIYFCLGKKFKTKLCGTLKILCGKAYKKVCNKCCTKNFCNLHAKNRYIGLKTATKQIFNISIFVTLQACIVPLISAIDGLIVVPLIAKTGLSRPICCSLFGIEDGIITSLVAMPTIISSSVGSAIIPNIRANASDSTATKQNVFNAIKIVWLASIFCAFVFIFFSRDIIQFLYAGGLSANRLDEFLISADLLKINGFNVIYLSLLGLSGSILQGLDRPKIPLISMVIALPVRYAVLLFCLTKSYINIYGLAFADMAFYVVSLLLNFAKIKRICGVKFLLLKTFALPVFCCGVIMLVMWLIKRVTISVLPFKIDVALVMLVGACLYFALLSLVGSLNIKGSVNAILKKRQQI